jgi:hypothetical protein
MVKAGTLYHLSGVYHVDCEKPVDTIDSVDKVTPFPVLNKELSTVSTLSTPLSAERSEQEEELEIY